MSSISARVLASLVLGWREATAAPAYSALAGRIRLLILDGRIPLGTRVPAGSEGASATGA